MSSPMWRYCSSGSAAEEAFEEVALTAKGAAAKAADPKPIFCRKERLLVFIEGLLGVLILSMSNQSAGITSRSMLFLPGKDAWVKRSFLEIEGDTDLSQNWVWAQKRKSR